MRNGRRGDDKIESDQIEQDRIKEEIRERGSDRGREEILPP